MSHMVVNKMGPPSRMLIRWVCPNQQMATFQTRETTNGTTRYLNHINKFADQQDGPTTHIVVSGPISLFLLSRKHKMGCANCIPVSGSVSEWVSCIRGCVNFWDLFDEKVLCLQYLRMYFLCHLIICRVHLYENHTFGWTKSYWQNVTDVSNS